MTKSSLKENKKYRPVLSSSAIAHIVALAKTESPISSASVEVIATLAPFLAKIENSGITAAYTSNPKKSLEESLGLTSPLDVPHSTNSKEERWEWAYAKYALNPTECSLSEIQAAREHMYLNDLMTEEEALDFEAE